jgi:hypothetical protein
MHPTRPHVSTATQGAPFDPLSTRIVRDIPNISQIHRQKNMRRWAWVSLTVDDGGGGPDGRGVGVPLRGHAAVPRAGRASRLELLSRAASSESWPRRWAASRRMARRMRSADHPHVHLAVLRTGMRCVHGYLCVHLFVPRRRLGRRSFPPAFTSSSPGHGRGGPRRAPLTSSSPGPTYAGHGEEGRAVVGAGGPSGLARKSS